MPEFSDNFETIKKSALEADSLMRRLVHIPQGGTIRVSTDGQSRLASASLNLRNNNYISDETKNNTFNVEDVIFGSVSRNIDAS